MISAVPKPSERKKAHSCETPRSFGLTAAIASAVASLAAVARSPIASRAALALSPIRSALLRNSSAMGKGYPELSADIGDLTQLREKVGGLGSRYLHLSTLFPSCRLAILRSYP